MESYIVETPVGLFAVDKDGSLVARLLFGKKSGEAAEKMRVLRSGRSIPELDQFVLSLRKSGFDTLVTETDLLAKALTQAGADKTVVEAGAPVAIQLRQRLSTDWKGRLKWLKRQRLDAKPLTELDEYQKFVRQVTMELARVAVTAAAAKRDLYAVQAVRAIDDIDKTVNLFAGRIREWYGLHFPELDRIVDKNDTYARLVADLGPRSNFTEENLQKEGIPQDKMQQMASAARRSMGASFPEEDLEWLRSFCKDTLELFKFREKAETYVDEVMGQAAPNASAILGSVLTARLMSIAGGLENLAKMPASTMQVLGAEKALFRSLKTGARPPKHGVIFQYASIHQSPRWQRGKIARALSGKLAIAARVDAFGGEFIGDKLARDLEKKVAEIQEKYREPPVRASRDEDRRRQEGRRRGQGRRRDERRRR